jgi:hypothetical protein
VKKSVLFFWTTLFSLCIVIGSLLPANAAPINPKPYSLIGPNFVDFNDVMGASFPGIKYDGILSSGGLDFAERFVGQILTFNGDLDELSGLPTGPLTLQVGNPGQNLSVGQDLGDNGLYPYGPKGFPNADGYGEGAFALLFPAPVSEFGFESFFSSGGEIFVQFFKNNGEFIDVVVVAGGGTFGFEREGLIKDIAGVTIHTLDPGGLAYDNIVYGEPIPIPGAVWLLGSGLLGFVGFRRRLKK